MPSFPASLSAILLALVLSTTFISGSGCLLPKTCQMPSILLKKSLRNPKAGKKKLLLDSAHDAMPYYDYCKANNITPFIDLNWKCGRPPVYKDDITIGKDGIPLCPQGFPMKQAAVEPKKGRIKYRCSKISYKGRTPHCTCEKAMLGCQIWTERPSHSERQSKTF